jgi:hypothetical protein
MASHLHKFLRCLAFISPILLSGCRPETSDIATRSAEPVPEDGLRITTDPDVVFRRAFWAHPSADDVIISGELREWIDPDTGNIESWQWFIHLRPGVALKDTLQFGGRFEFVSVEPAAAEIPAPAPQWFSPGEAGILRSANGMFTVFKRQTDGSIFACDSGSGFAAPH